MAFNKILRSRGDDHNTSIYGDEFKENNGGGKHLLSKSDIELYHEEDDVAMPVIRIKTLNVPGGEFKWKIFQDNRVVFTIESIKLNKRESDFLRTVEGNNFMMLQYKLQIKSFNAFKKELKVHLKTNKGT